MSTTQKSVIFLAITFAFSWAVVIGAHFAGLTEEPIAAVGALTLMMAGPAIAALICAFAFEKGRRVEALGLKFRPNWWWLFAWLIPLAIAALSVMATIFLSDRSLVDIGGAMIAAAGAQSPEQAAQMRAIPNLTWVIVGASVVVGALINTPILTFTEELGWRGYLYHLWRPAGFWKSTLATGAIWGVWHAPAIFFYGLNYPQNRDIGIPIFIAYCMLLAPLFALVRERGGSVWAAGIMHGTVNAVAGLTLAGLSNPSFPWGGMVGIGGFVALAVATALVALTHRPALAPRGAGA